MAKVVVAFVFLAFLVASTVESARVLKQYDATTAETFATDVPYNYNAAPLETEEALPPPAVEAEMFTDAPYNYSAEPAVTEEASANEGVFATEGFLVGETTSAEPYVFDATTQDFDDTLADQDVTSLALDTSPEFEFQETPNESSDGGPGIFAFDESAPAFAP